eukprot:Nk52_evm17s284 gene=Nk52_evmTU17s284
MPTRPQPRNMRSNLAFGRANQNQYGYGAGTMEAGCVIPKAVMENALGRGNLNFSNKGLTEIPDSFWSYFAGAYDKDVAPNLSGETVRWWDFPEFTKLVLACNEIKDIPEDKLGLLPDLVVLDMHQNHLLGIPRTINLLRNLCILDVSHNSIANLPKELFCLSNLQVLLLSNNCLSFLAEELGQLRSLQKLDISRNKLSRVCTNLGTLPNIVSLNVSHNHLTRLPREMQEMVMLKELIINDNEIDQLPDSIGMLPRIEIVEARNNKLQYFPYLCSCENLKELYCGYNCLRTLDFLKAGYDSEDVGAQQLNIIDLSNNNIDSIPSFLNKLNLTRVDISNNNISTLPSELGLVTSLKSLVLTGNPLKSISHEVLSKGTIALLEYLRKKIPICEGGSADPVTEEISEKLRYCTILEYNEKRCKHIPISVWSGIGNPEGVKSIVLRKNCLSCVPSEIFEYTPLVENIDLSVNSIKEIPCTIILLKKLSVLKLDGNLIQDLPREFSALQSLRELYLANNRLKDIPNQIYDLKSLETLVVCDNALTTLLVEKLSELPELSFLDVSNNSITELPPTLGRLENITTLNVGGNAFRVPRPAVIAKGTAEIMKYLRDRIPN